MGKEMNDLVALKEAGACGFTDDGIPIVDPTLCYNAMLKAVEFDMPISLHEEDPAFISENGINILDISQTVVSDYFNMMMIVDITSCRKSFEDVAAGLGELGQSMGLKIRCQKSEIFEKMHRV